MRDLDLECNRAPRLLYWTVRDCTSQDEKGSGQWENVLYLGVERYMYSYRTVRHGSAREITRRIHGIKIYKTRVQIN